MQKSSFVFSIVMAVVFLSAGCASRKAYIIARCDPQFSPASTNKITIANHQQPRPEDRELGLALAAELKQQGFRIAPPEDADYTLTYWIEKNWQHQPPSSSYEYRPTDPQYGTWPNSGMSPGIMRYPSTTYSPAQHPLSQTTYQEPPPSQGIRLRLFSRAKSPSAQPHTAWEGYVDGGLKVSAERQPVLLRTLLGYFGKDHVGRVRLAE